MRRRVTKGTEKDRCIKSTVQYVFYQEQDVLSRTGFLWTDVFIYFNFILCCITCHIHGPKLLPGGIAEYVIVIFNFPIHRLKVHASAKAFII